MSVLDRLPMTSRLALVLCVLLLALPLLRLAELVTAQGAAVVVATGPLPEEDETGREVVVKAAIPRASRHAVPEARLSAIERPRPTRAHTPLPLPRPASELSGANGCGAVLRC